MIEAQAGQTQEEKNGLPPVNQVPDMPTDKSPQVAGFVAMGQKSRVREYAIYSLVQECQDFVESQSELMMLLMKGEKTKEDVEHMKQLLLNRDDMLAYIGTVIRDVVLL